MTNYCHTNDKLIFKEDNRSFVTDKKWMELALKQARLAEAKNEVPVGAVLVKDGKLIAQAHNRPITTNNPSAHAEIELLRNAGTTLNNYRLSGTTLYVTLEPCAMCFGAIVYARIDCVVFGAFDKKTGVCGSCVDFSNSQCFNHVVKIKGGVLVSECADLLQTFFKTRRVSKR